MSNFKLIGKAHVDELTCANKYRDEETGLTVVLVDVEGPVVNGYFVLSTEAHDDDGLPHTLEHLIFLGSEKYPYKGVLDLLANRCLASGTNAWTDTDHTCYTMVTAGCDGFLDLMPVYLDHILYPTLTDSGFTTEVHHISGEGEDGGVVYCEMQGRENTGESRTILKLLKTVYPKSGYSSETGGVLHNLRTSTSNEKVRDYHKKFYRPENLTLIITGKVTPERVFEALKPVQEKIKSKPKGEIFVKPWQSPVEKIKESKDIKILYPSDDEDCGLVYIGYMGPNCVNEYRKLAALGILLRYLTDTSVSPLQREMVEIDDPFASRVSFCTIENLESLLYFTFENAPIKKIDEIQGKLKEVLNKIANGEEKIDMQRMQSIIDREFLESLSSLESSPHDTLALLLVGDSVYGKSEEDLQERLNLRKHHEYYKSIDESQWIELLNSYFISAMYVCIRAYPSIEEQNKMSKEELSRIEEQRKNLGENGLKEKGEILKKSMELNEIEPPSSMLTQVPVPSTDGINYHYLKVYKSSETSNVQSVFNFADIPIYTEVFDLHTNFTYIMISMNSESLDHALRPYLLLFMELLLESPVQRGDKLIPYEEVVSALERDTVCSGSGVGLDSKSSFKCGPFSHVAMVTMQIEPKKYETVVDWIIDLLHSSVFTAERVRVVASKMHNGISQVKRKGNFMAADILKTIFYSKESNVKISTILKQQKFLAALLKNLEDPDQLAIVLNDLNTIRNFLTKKENLALHIATNISEHSKEGVNLSKAWGKIRRDESGIMKNELRVIPDWKEINYKGYGLKDGINGTVIGMGSVESAFLFHAVEAINDFLSPDLPALMLYLQYLTQLEGPLWKQIRGQGLAYGYTIAPKPNEGLLLLSLYRASNVVAAFKETKRIIETQLKDGSWDENLLESAKSSLIFEIIERERSVGNLVSQGLLFSYKQVPSNYNQMLVEQVDKVTKEQLADIGEKYMSQLFSTAAKTGVVCHPDKVKEVTEGFASMNIHLSGVSGLDESILNF